MKVEELKIGQGKVDIQLTISQKDDIRSYNKYGKEMKVANAIGEDDSGKIKVSLWNDDAEKVQVGSKIKITNGYVSEFNGEKQLSSGKYGSLELVDNFEGEEAKKDKPIKKSPKKVESKENFDDDAF
jgi:replication factor A1